MMPEDIKMNTLKVQDGYLLWGDCLYHMSKMRSQSVDLVMGSPPYEDAREYEELGFSLTEEHWVKWMVDVFAAALRICKGPVVMVVGHGKGARSWSGAPALLMADLIRRGITLRSPCFYYRHGIFGSGGKDWFSACIEWIVVATNGSSELLWHNNLACAEPWKYKPGGGPTYRMKDGTRVKGKKRNYNTELANPGNVIMAKVGGGKMGPGSNIAHENEAPYPTIVPERFIRSFCPPGGIVYDPFGGSGTTIEVAIRRGRKFIASDIRESQIKLMERRVRRAHRTKGFVIP